MHGVADLEGSMGDDPVTRSEEIGKAVVLEDEKLILVQEVIVDLARVDRGEREPGAAGAPAATIGRCGPGSGDSGTMSIPMRSRHPSYDNTYYVSFDGVAPTRDHCGLFFLPTVREHGGEALAPVELIELRTQTLQALDRERKAIALLSLAEDSLRDGRHDLARELLQAVTTRYPEVRVVIEKAGHVLELLQAAEGKKAK